MIFNNKLELSRIEKVNELRDIGKNPYGHNIKKELTLKEFKDKFSYVKDLNNKRDENAFATVAGRVKFLRLMGKAAFAKIEDEDTELQVYFSKDKLGEEWFASLKKLLEVGDIIVVNGFAFLTKTDELTINAKDLQIATKSIVPLPEKFHGLVDVELRYRQRYLDMIMNKEVKENFRLRSLIVRFIRKYFENLGFLEVETPMMHPVAGGANAKPFITHHNALKVDRYLRIAPELYLKRLVVGGFEAVFEINRNFRNEGMDHTHNPEFTMLEFYWAYHTYKDLMDLTEDLFRYIIKNCNLSQKIKFSKYEIDFSKPFNRISYYDALEKIGQIDKETIFDKSKAISLLKQNGIKVNENLSLGHIQAELFDEFVEDKLIDPTYIIDFPIEISPLARRNDNNENIAERFELFIAGKEIANGFNELNDPLDQYKRFAKQLEAKESGDDEAHEMDEDYVRALGYGMPPTAGEGIGIDRLVMLLTDNESIRDVILFPAMKPIKKENIKNEEN